MKKQIEELLKAAEDKGLRYQAKPVYQRLWCLIIKANHARIDGGFLKGCLARMLNRGVVTLDGSLYRFNHGAFWPDGRRKTAREMRHS